MRTDLTKKFLKKYRKSPLKVQHACDRRLVLFREDKNDPRLNDHKLAGDLKKYHSININGDWRAIYREIDGVIEWVEFVDLGTHSELYK